MVRVREGEDSRLLAKECELYDRSMNANYSGIIDNDLCCIDLVKRQCFVYVLIRARVPMFQPLCN